MGKEEIGFVRPNAFREPSPDRRRSFKTDRRLQQDRARRSGRYSNATRGDIEELTDAKDSLLSIAHFPIRTPWPEPSPSTDEGGEN